MARMARRANADLKKIKELQNKQNDYLQTAYEELGKLLGLERTKACIECLYDELDFQQLPPTTNQNVLIERVRKNFLKEKSLPSIRNSPEYKKFAEKVRKAEKLEITVIKTPF